MIFFVVGGVHSLPVVAILFAIVLLDYGGGFGTMPSFTADYFGTKYMGVNYGWILLAWGVGGVVGPIFVSLVKDATGSFSGALPVIAVMLLVAAIRPSSRAGQGRRRRAPTAGPTSSRGGGRTHQPGARRARAPRETSSARAASKLPSPLLPHRLCGGS